MTTQNFIQEWMVVKRGRAGERGRRKKGPGKKKKWLRCSTPSKRKVGLTSKEQENVKERENQGGAGSTIYPTRNLIRLVSHCW